MRAALTGTILLLALSPGPRPAALRADAPLIYSARPDDPWNRVFAALFTRTVRVRFTNEFPERAPFSPPQDLFSSMLRDVRISAQSFERHEDGDRAIEALYPTFLNGRGPRLALIEPLYSDLSRALRDALDDRTARAPLARALMQADLWSAYDGLAALAAGPDPTAPRTQATQVSNLLARLIARTLLTPAEVEGLPRNYQNGRAALPLPDVFRPDGDWLEISFGLDHHRLHEAFARDRRAARIFIRPSVRPANADAFIKSAMSFPNAGIGGVALLIQPIVIDTAGHLVPAPLVSDVQIRTFTRDAGGALVSTMVTEYELSRKRLLSDPRGGGLVAFDEHAQAYIPVSGNDYDFATPQYIRGPAEPVIGTLRTRCSACHGPRNAFMMSFATQDPAHTPPPTVLAQPNDDRARAVAAAKEARDDFTRLIAAAGLR